MPENFGPERRLRAEIDKLKDPAPYKETFETVEAQQLSQAIDLLAALQNGTFLDASQVGYEKLRNAKLYLDKLLKKHLESEKE
ncbi:MAG TPA: hypothetical protein VMF91_04080 [Bryobacteraceae bacterium]|nr:hypothetical protein [Bryobacteraceae bacterium]